MNPSIIEIKKVKKELPIFTVDLNQYSDILNLAKEAIFDLKNKTPNSIESNVKANYVSSWVSHLESEKLAPLCNLVLSFCREVSKTYFKTELKLKVFNCWGMIYEKEDHTVTHNHYPSLFAAVIYLDAFEDSAPIVFEDELSLQPKTGTLVVFPGLINHRVPETKNKRIVIAMNIEHE